MAKIKILPAWEAQKIAAGEVVERPASIVKELIENAIDAGADSIDLEIMQGGKSKIAIHDNGHGMSAEDAQLCIHNHATSKITSVTELPQIQTFGFRGEALASIAAASKLTIITKEAEAAHATRLVFDAGACTEEQSVMRQTGTSIIVEDIFFNIPARRKFLKKDETEWRAIYQLVSALALAHRHVTFTLSHNERRILTTEATNDPTQRFCQVLGMDLHEHLINLQHDGKYAQIEGITTRAPKTRYDKNQIFIFVNRRWVKNYKLVSALIKGYDNILLPQHYPLAAIFITVPEDTVDINVHPRKEEVQFMHPLGVERSIQEAVSTAQEAAVKAVLQATAHLEKRHDDTYYMPPQHKDFHYNASTAHAPSLLQEPEPSATTAYQHTAPLINKTAPCVHPNEPNKLHATELLIAATNTPAPVQQQQTSPQGYTILGQLHLTYILVQTNEGLMLIDQHAAHERILFEQFRERMHNAEATDLLFPQLVRLTPSEYASLLPHLDEIAQQGIGIEPFGESTLSVRALPTTMKHADMQSFFEELAQKLLNQNIETTEKQPNRLYENLHATMACKAAIKSGDRLNTTEMNALVEQILTTNHSTTCPHGRPTTWRLTLQEIERTFQRHL